MARRERGFERAGASGHALDDLPAQRRRELRQARAWLAAAGDELARRVRFESLTRGRLRARIVSQEWGEAAIACMPELAARVSRHPGGGAVRGWTLLGPDGACIAEGRPAEDEGPVDSSADGPCTTRVALGPAPPADDGGDARDRLARLRDRYLARQRPDVAQKP